MAEIIYLKKGERAPKGPGVFTIEVVSNRAQDKVVSGPDGTTVTTKAVFFEQRLADFQDAQNGPAPSVIYVKGWPRLQ